MENRTLVFFSAIMFFLMPWYYMSSGKPQPVDAAILLTFSYLTILTFHEAATLFSSPVYRQLNYFFIYSIIILLVNYILNPASITINLIIQNLYFAMVVSVFLIVLLRFQAVYGAKKTYQILLYLLLVSSFLPLAEWLRHNVHAGRVSLTFNNPNQLGFFSLVNISLVYYVGLLARNQEIVLNKKLPVILLNINLAFLFLSASRACYPVILLYLMAYPLYFRFNLRGDALWLYRILGIGCAVVALLLLMLKLYAHMKMIRFSRLPLDVASISFDFYFRALRGLNFESMRISEFLLGNGSYTTQVRGMLEFHNNFIALFNQIGILGLFYYIYLNYLMFIQLIRKGVLYLIPLLCYLFYSMFQYSFRTRLNWLFIAMIIFVTVSRHLTESARSLEPAQRRQGLWDKDADV